MESSRTNNKDAYQVILSQIKANIIYLQKEVTTTKAQRNVLLHQLQQLYFAAQSSPDIDEVVLSSTSQLLDQIRKENFSVGT